MVKRKRNTIGQFVSSSSMSIGSKNGLLQENLMQKAKTIFMVLFFYFNGISLANLSNKIKANKNLDLFCISILHKTFHK